MLDSLIILGKTGEKIYDNYYLPNFDTDFLGNFLKHLLKSSNSSRLPFLIVEGRFAYISVNFNDLYFLCVTDSETIPSAVIAILEQLINILKSFYVPDFTFSDLKAKPVLLYEVIEEVIVNGSIQCDNVNVLKSSIKDEKTIKKAFKKILVDKKIMKKDSKMPNPGDSPVMQTSSAFYNASSQDRPTEWRPVAPKYDINRALVDVIENYSILVDQHGNTKNMSVFGKIVLSSELSGMPHLVMKLDNPFGYNFESVQLHPAVDSSVWNNDRRIELVPPDGVSELLKYFYHKKTLILPVNISSVVDTKNGVFEIKIHFDSKLVKKVSGVEVDLNIPHSFVLSPSLGTTCGKYTIHKNTNIVNWSIGTVICDTPTHHKISGKFTSNNKLWSSSHSKPFISANISCRFSKHSVSGFSVSRLNISNINYPTTKGIKYSSYTNRYEVRCQ